MADSEPVTRNRSTPLTGIAPAEASRRILDHVRPLSVECVPLHETLGQVLAADVQSPIDLPHWDNSAMDGYAVRSEDLQDRQRELEVVETIPAGGFPARPIGLGECARIFTGAPIPQGADTVIRQEDTTSPSPGRVRITNLRDLGRNVRHRGEDIARNSIVLQKGTTIGPAEVGVLASVAAGEVYVHRRPRVGIMASGDEVVDLDQRDAILAGKKIASSNSYTMVAMVKQAGGEPVYLGIARDDPDDIRRRVARASTTDLLVTSGGVSVGEHDHVRRVLEEGGLDLQFWRIRMRPGAPVAFGLLRGVPWIGLPGNPVSTMVTFELFVRPAIRRLLGHNRLFRGAIQVRAGERMDTHPPLQHFLRVGLRQEDGTLTAFLTGAQGSGILTSMAKADALLIVPEDREQVEVGETCWAIPLGESHHQEAAPF